MKAMPALLLMSLIINSAAEAQPGRFVVESELIGYWEMIPLPEVDATKVNKVDPWPVAYQWFGFYEDGSLATMGSSEHKPMTRSELEEVFSTPSLKGSRFEYMFDASGFLLVTAAHLPGYEEVWGVNIITEEFKMGEIELRQGDILMTLAGGEDRGIVYMRHLRRLE
jgi:hypothetical protein